MTEYIMLIFYICVVLIAVFVIVSTIWSYRNKCKRNYMYKKDAFVTFLNNYDESDNAKNALLQSFDIILKHAYSHLKVFFEYQVICKVFGVASLLFTTLNFIKTTDNAISVYTLVYTAIAILSVIIVIYINPLDRARKYLESWRMWNIYVSKLLVAITESIEEYRNILKQLPDNYKEEDRILDCDKF